MKKILTFTLMSVLFLTATAFTALQLIEDHQLQRLAGGIVDEFEFHISFSGDSSYVLPEHMIQRRINLIHALKLLPHCINPEAKVTGYTNLPLPTREESIRHWFVVDSVYQSWVTFALKHREVILKDWTVWRSQEFWSMVDAEAVNRKFSYAVRSQMFWELTKLINHYDHSLTMLLRISNAQRADIFALVKQLSGANAFVLQKQLQNNQVSDLTRAYDTLGNKLQAAGIVVHQPCGDFYNWKFTRYDRQYDYLFALARWAGRCDGVPPKDGVPEFKMATIDALLRDGETLLDRAWKGLGEYELIK